MKHLILALALCLAAGSALAQSTPDPRLAGPMIQKLQGDVALLDAALKATRDDATKRQQELDEWFKGWFAKPEPKPAK